MGVGCGDEVEGLALVVEALLASDAMQYKQYKRKNKQLL